MKRQLIFCLLLVIAADARAETLTKYPFEGKWAPIPNQCQGGTEIDNDETFVVSGNKIINNSGACAASKITQTGNRFTTVETWKRQKEKPRQEEDDPQKCWRADFRCEQPEEYSVR